VRSGAVSLARSVDARAPIVWDVALAVICLVSSLTASPVLDEYAVVAIVVVDGAVALRRREPAVALAAAFGGVVLVAGLSVAGVTEMPWAYLALWVLLFGFGLRSSTRPAFLVAGVVVVTATTALLVPAYDHEALTAASRTQGALSVLGMCAAAYLLGGLVQGRRAQSAHERAEAARFAVLAERTRIARELHDVIGHNLSVITSLATGGAVAVDGAPADAVRAFEAIGRVSRSSVRDVRRVLEVLRHDDSVHGAALTPQPGVADVGQLVDSAKAAGARVSWSMTGDLENLSVGRQLAIYRIVQESLTNAIKHAGPSPSIDMTVTRDRDVPQVVVTVRNTVVPGAHPGVAADAGHGIIGMTERAQAYGGEVHASQDADGWTVRARILTDAVEDLSDAQH
jgi:signal transduction histidine kinase